MHADVINAAKVTLDEAVGTHNPTHVFAMFSGGHDSLVATHLTLQHLPDAIPVHINTGIGIEQTRKFVRETCWRWGRELKEYRSPYTYEDLVLQHGFPGPKQHRIMYISLKERCIEQLLRDHRQQRGERMLLVTGVRAEESTRRMGHVQEIKRRRGQVWVAPILEWSKYAINDYIEQQNLQRNPVVDMLHMSGECLCGAYAHPGDLEELRQWFPDKAREIEELEARVHDAGYPWRWDDEGPPQWWQEYRQGQMFLGDEIEMMCVGCRKRAFDDDPDNKEASG